MFRTLSPAFQSKLALVAVCVWMAVLCGPPATAETAPLPESSTVVFDRYAQSTYGLEFLKRTFSPVAGEAMSRKLSAMGRKLAPQPLDLSKER